MKIIISPAKKMNVDTDSFEISGLPAFMEDTRVLMQAIRDLSFAEAKALWKCNDQLARLNYDRFQSMEPDADIEVPHTPSPPASGPAGWP